MTYLSTVVRHGPIELLLSVQSKRGRFDSGSLNFGPILSSCVIPATGESSPSRQLC
jgi:hypothetical protein